MNSFARKEVFIPKGGNIVQQLQEVGVSVSAFVPGDAIGEAKRSLAVKDAIEQGALQEPGSHRAKLYAMQEALGQFPEVDCPLQHTFAPGIYIRTIFLPKGTTLVGKIHKHQHGNVLSCGTVRVYTEYGGLERLSGPLTMLSDPGTKRAVFAETDSVWTTIHPNPTNTRDLSVLEDQIIAKTYEEYEAFVKENAS